MQASELDPSVPLLIARVHQMPDEESEGGRQGKKSPKNGKERCAPSLKRNCELLAGQSDVGYYGRPRN